MVMPRANQPTAPRKGWSQHGEHRLRGRKLQRARAGLFAAEPLCRMCVAEGHYDLRARATIRDHIIPLAEGGTDEPENIQPLCQPHHDAKTLEEARRGALRGGAGLISAAMQDGNRGRLEKCPYGSGSQKNGG
jgi:5-methylcytosine-specific restriction protein A